MDNGILALIFGFFIRPFFWLAVMPVTFWLIVRFASPKWRAILFKDLWRGVGIPPPTERRVSRLSGRQ